MVLDYTTKKRGEKPLFVYSEPGSNRYGHFCPQDFKSGVSTYSTIRATQSLKTLQMYNFYFILQNFSHYIARHNTKSTQIYTLRSIENLSA